MTKLGRQWLVNVASGTTLAFYDSEDMAENDDFTLVRVKANIGPRGLVIKSFESSYTDTYVEVAHFHHNGLDGKVSSVAVNEDLGKRVVFYEGNGGTQNIVCTIPASTGVRDDF